MRKLAIALTVTFGLALGGAVAQDQPGEGVSIQPGIATWQSALPIEAIFAQLLGELGYDVQDAQSVSNPIFYQSVTQGDVDYWANGWFPLHNAQLPENFEENAAVVGTIVERGALQGYLVDAASIEEYDITSLEDFKREEVKEAFDANGDGKADLVGCPPGWGCEQVISHHMDAYDLHDHVNVITASYAASFADALARYRNDEPVLYYTWTPNFTTVQLVPGEDVRWINVPEIIPSEGQEGLEDAMVAEGMGDTAVSDTLRFGYVANDIRTVANRDFLEANPAAHELLDAVEIPLADISEMTARISEGESSDDEVAAMAQEWIENNRAQVDEWLDQARGAGASM
ncbi:MAG: glycine betaine/L-proline ABC transporter substrate-binding protein ProX [Trueperaceae bacterium]|nr:glycine betaine/L-proline ABC transporter substrate-binding protein ProX [Trueperaceae bacterium]